MGIKEDLAHAKAMRAHLEDQIAMDDAESKRAARRALIFSLALLSIVIAGGVTYGIRRRISA